MLIWGVRWGYMDIFQIYTFNFISINQNQLFNLTYIGRLCTTVKPLQNIILGCSQEHCNEKK